MYKWSSSVTILLEDITLSGDAHDVFIFQIAQTFTMGADVIVKLEGAVPSNIFWQVAGAVRIKAGAHLEGSVLGLTSVHFLTGASLAGRIFAQTAVTLGNSTITAP